MCSGRPPELFVVGASPLLRPDEQVFEAMLAGWRDQQLSRNLAADTIEGRLGTVRRFQQFTNDWPWSWRPVDMEEFSAEARGRGRARSTIRGSQCAIRLFCEYVSDPRYQWTAVQLRFASTGTPHRTPRMRGVTRVGVR